MRFFLKIFFSFLITVLLAGWALFWIGHHLRAEMDERLHQHLHQLLDERRQLAVLLATQGVEAVRHSLLASSFKESLLLLDDKGHDLLGRPMPEKLLKYLNQELDPAFRHHFGPRPFPGEPSHSQGVEEEGPPPHQPLLTYDSANQRYKIVILPPSPRWWLIIKDYPLRLLGVIAIIALVVFLLARHFTQPIRHLQSMAMALASGNLTTRVAAIRGRIPDELSDLAGDFNFMAQQLEDLFHAQHRLLRDVSHELRSPLARIRVAMGLLEQSQTEVDDNLTRMAMELERLDELIGQIITISRPVVPGGIRRDVLVDLGEMVRDVVADGRFEMERQQRLLVLERVDTALLWADATGLHSAIDNVLRNALHHTDQQGTVFVELIREGNYAWLLVADQGPGVPESDLKHIFSPFFRLEESRERVTGGFGLGLAIAARVVSEHGGEISARNRPEGGLVISITLTVEPNTLL
ncbi:MAG: HAMP domain-containing protein [Magnetococcales bacterium]|nr:HAMP domain-containing protein [Magnetococcales bacterium]